MLPPVAAPPQWTGTAAEWTSYRDRVVAKLRPNVRDLPADEYSAQRAGVIDQADHDRRAADSAAELRRIEARHSSKG